MLAETECFLPKSDQRYLAEHGINAHFVTDNNQLGMIIRDFKLPAGVFQVDAADILVIVPTGYPDVPPDMFYADPWLSLKGTGRYPECADQPLDFSGRRWQRWSRHNNDWRPGIDGIRTHLRRVIKAIEEAK